MLQQQRYRFMKYTTEMSKSWQAGAFFYAAKGRYLVENKKITEVPGICSDKNPAAGRPQIGHRIGQFRLC